MTEEREGNQETPGTKVWLVWTGEEAGPELLDYLGILGLEGNKDPKGPKEIKVKKAKRVIQDKKEPKAPRVWGVRLVPEEWWAERAWRERPGWTGSLGRTAVKACRESKVMMGRKVLLANLALVVKLVSRDSQEIRGPSDPRVSGVFVDRAALWGKEVSEEGWDCQGFRETRGQKDNLVI